VESYVAIEPKAVEKGDRKNYRKRGDVRRYGRETDIDTAFRYDDMVDEVVPDEVENHVHAAADRITEYV